MSMVIMAMMAASAYADSTTTRMGITKPSIGSSGWGTKTNNNWDLVDSTVAALAQTNTFTSTNTFSSTATFSGAILISTVASGRVPVATTGGQIISYSGFTHNGTTLTVAGVSNTGNESITGLLSGTTSTFLQFTDSGLTSTRIPYMGTGGLFQDSANMTFNGTTETVSGVSATTGTVSASFYAATAAGKVGMGTNAPSDFVEIRGTGASNTLNVSTSSTGSPGALVVTNAGNVTMAGNLTVSGSANLGAVSGLIKQMIIFTTTTPKTTTSSTYQVTSASTTITPSSSTNKVLVCAFSDGQDNQPSATTAAFTIERNAVDLGAASASGLVIIGGSITVQTNVPTAMCYLDSPATTSKTSYAVFLKSSNNATTVAWGNNSLQTLLLFEISP